MPRIVRFHEFGDADVLRVEEAEPVAPGPGEVRIDVEAFALNRADALLRENRYIEAPELPSRLGYDAAGVVAAVGEGVEGVRVGERVATYPCFLQSRHGVYGDWAIVPARALLRHPENLTPKQASTLGVQYMTGYFALFEIGQLGEGDAVLVKAASSSTGVAAMQLAKTAGATVIAATRSQSKRDPLLALGADRVVVTPEDDLAQCVREITGGAGVKLAFDPVGGPGVAVLVDAIGVGGRVVLYGLLDARLASFEIGSLLGKSGSIHGYGVFGFTGNEGLGIPPQEEPLERAQRFLYEHLASGALVPRIAREFALHEVADAHRFMESNAQVGKIVVSTGD